MGQHHAAAAIPAKLQLIQSITNKFIHAKVLDYTPFTEFCMQEIEISFPLVANDLKRLRSIGSQEKSDFHLATSKTSNRNNHLSLGDASFDVYSAKCSTAICDNEAKCPIGRLPTAALAGRSGRRQISANIGPVPLVYWCMQHE